MVGVLGEIRATPLLGQSLDEVAIDADSARDRLQIVGVSPEEIDPQELALVQAGRQARRQLDLPVVAVRVVETSVDPGFGFFAQRTTARRVTTTIARIAVPYWRTFMARSVRRPRAPGAPIGTPSTTGLTIDVVSFERPRIRWRSGSQRRSAAIPRACVRIGDGIADELQCGEGGSAALR
jgi:hypothetical protein